MLSFYLSECNDFIIRKINSLCFDENFLAKNIHCFYPSVHQNLYSPKYKVCQDSNR